MSATQISTLTPRDLARMLESIVAEECGCVGAWHTKPVTSEQIENIEMRIETIICKSFYAIVFGASRIDS